MSLSLPTHCGFGVEWETGKVREIRRKDGTLVKTVKLKDTIYTTDKAKAERVFKQKQAQGFKNVQMYECIF